EEWREVNMIERGNDRWTASFPLTELGRYEYTLQAWVDRFASWCKSLAKKAAADQDVSGDLLEGAELVGQTARRITGAGADWLRGQADVLRKGRDTAARVELALDPA